MRTSFLVYCWLLLSSLFSGVAHAQQPLPNPNLDLRNAGTGREIFPLDNGAFIVHGNFNRINDEETSNIVKFFASGELDTAWNTSVNGQIFRMLRADDRLYLFGNFSSVNNQPRRGLASVSISTGQLNDWNPNGGGSSSYTFRSATRLGDHLYVAGDFSAIGTTVRTNLAKIHALTGTLDSFWTPSATGSTFENVRNIDNDGISLYFSGSFTSVNGNARSRAAKVDSATGTLAQWAPVFNSNVIKQAIDGNFFYATGCFSNVNGASRIFAARIRLDTGALDSWNPNITDGCADHLHVTTSHVYISGSRATVRRFDKSGAGLVDSTFTPNLQGTWFSNNAVEVSPSRLVVAGMFNHVDGNYSPGFALLNTSNGTLARPILAESTNANVLALLPTSDGGLLVGGDFSRVANSSPPLVRIGLLKLTATGIVDPSFSLNQLNTDGTNTVFTLARSANHIYIGRGSFFASLNFRSILTRLNNNLQFDPSWTPEVNSTVSTIAVDESSQTLLIGGFFTQVGGQTRNRLAELSLGSSSVTPWNPNANALVTKILLDGTNLLVSGSFTSIGGAARERIAKLSRASGLANLAFTANANDRVQTLLMAPNNVLYAGGFFTTVGGLDRRNLVKLDAQSGVVDPTWNMRLAADSFTVSALAPAGSGAIYVGGSFGTIGGFPLSNLARVQSDGTVDLGFTPNQLNTTVQAIAEQDGRVTAGGSFAGHVVAFSLTAAPAEIEVAGANDQVIQNGDTTPSTLDGTDFGNALVSGGLQDATFIIKNRGGVNLFLNDVNPRVVILGPNAADFAVITQPVASISGGESSNIEIRFDPSADGLRVATVSIANNDSDENPTTFVIQGTGTSGPLPERIFCDRFEGTPCAPLP